MPTCVINYFAEPDERELTDVSYQCSTLCMFEELRGVGLAEPNLAGEANLSDGGSIGWGTNPGGSETQSDVRCSVCDELLWRGLSHYENTT